MANSGDARAGNRSGAVGLQCHAQEPSTRLRTNAKIREPSLRFPLTSGFVAAWLQIVILTWRLMS
jgi:hypothetical protein